MRHGLRASAILPFSRPLSADFFPGIIIRFNAHRTRHRIFVSSESAAETVRSSIRVIFRRESLRVMKIDHRVVLLFWSRRHPWERRFHLISQCCNLLEMKATLKYAVPRVLFHGNGGSLPVSFCYRRCAGRRMKSSIDSSGEAPKTRPRVTALRVTGNGRRRKRKLLR